MFVSNLIYLALIQDGLTRNHRTIPDLFMTYQISVGPDLTDTQFALEFTNHNTTEL
jgi:hypothetical protein